MKFYDFSAKKMNGQEVKMEAFKGKVVLVVNTASKCADCYCRWNRRRVWIHYRAYVRKSICWGSKKDRYDS